jgi:hypothetical protein
MGFIKKNLVTILVVLLILVGGYFGYGFISGGSSSDTLSVATPDGGGATVGGDLLVILANLKGLKLDDSIFSNPLFRNLKNFNVELSPEPIGRPNPFAPLDGSAGQNSQSLNVQIKSFKTQ